MFKFSRRSLRNLRGVHQDLVDVMTLALKKTPIDFMVIEGLRSVRRQRELFRSGKSKTMNSRHLTGHAVDIVPIINGKVSWDWDDYNVLCPYVEEAAKELNVPIEGGWRWKRFPDAPHWQLPWKHYPK